MIRFLPMGSKSQIRSNCKRQNEDCKLQIVNCKNYSRVLLYFAFLILHFAFFNAPALAATLTGKVAVEGKYNIKPRKNLEERIKAIRGLVVSNEGGLKNAVVSIKGLKGNNNQSLPRNVVIDQKNKTILPHVLPIPVGASVTFKSADPFVHRIISNSDTKKLRMEFAYEGAAMEATFDQPGIVEIWCDDHKRMQGWILVMETAFFAVTDEKGHFSIPNIPAGRYTVEVWHEILGLQTQEIELKEGEDMKIDFRLPGKEF
ncbi:MAG: carboxypeptidase regulatory-like domain-containing protein [Nitrospirota bacterium]